MLSSDSVN